jgi:tetratricopeptide (TPR) repeat protein
MVSQRTRETKSRFRHALRPATMDGIRAICVFGFLLCTFVPAAAEPPNQDEAFHLLQEGKRKEALRAFDAILASKPLDPSPALFATSAISLEDGDWRAARPRVRQLVKLRPASLQAWELMIQVDQAANDIPDRNAAISSLYAAWRSAVDPAIQSRVSFVRDRIFGPKRTLIGQETLDPGGDDIVRFVFQPGDEAGNPTHLILLRSDEATNQRWRDNGTVPFGTQVYHLDAVERLPNGRQTVQPYEFYLEEPNYDQVRDKVVAILNGEAKPLSGDADPYWTGDAVKP